MIDKSVTTIAVGKPYYLQLAQNLLESFLRWNADNAIIFLLLTDNPDFYQQYQTNAKVTVKGIRVAEDDKSFTSKFLLYQHCVADHNLFIDCDCLIYKDINFVFDSFKGSGNSFSAIGNTIATGNFFCDVGATISKFGLTALPKFVGSVYYFKKNDVARKVFEKASELKNSYDENGFIRLRGKENEEPLLAVAMALHHEKLLENDGQIKADLMYYEVVQTDILAGFACTKQPLHDITGGEVIPAAARPAIVHFNGSFTETWHYKADVFKLVNNKKCYVNIHAWTLFTMPAMIDHTLKKLLRPIYHALFGKRKISASQRV